ncbi:MAG: hypothetical protein DRN92_02650 [Thermoproteota archaeon]|nr:MAG: hypothetical protein DRN92_02650 [Candidatus Korarchaeota archaeon]
MDIVDRVLSGEKLLVAPLVAYPSLKLINGKANECLREPELHMKLMKASFEEFGLDIVFPLMDLTVEAESVGVKVTMKENSAPAVVEHLKLESNADLEGLEVPNPKTSGRLPLMIRTAELMQKLRRNTFVGFYVSGPFTLAGQLVGFGRLMRMVRKKPDLLDEIMSFSTDVILSYARELAPITDLLVLAEPMSSSISNEDFRRFSKSHISRIIEKVGPTWALHICGRANHLLLDMVETGAHILSFDDNIDLRVAAEKVPEDVILFGNYSPMKLATRPQGVVETEVGDMLKRMSDFRNLIVSTGCDVPYFAPLENIHAFMKAARSF